MTEDQSYVKAVGELELLRQEIKALQKQAEEDAYLIEAQKREILVLQAARDDAERYRWLRDDANDVHFWIDEIPYLSGDKFDQAIDAAMEAENA